MSPSAPAFDWFPLVLSLKVASVATLLALGLGLGLGWLFAHKRFVGRSLLEAVLVLPMVLPPTVVGYAILLALGRHSWLGGQLYRYFDYTLIFNWHGAVVASAIVAMPLVFKSSIAAFNSVDPALESAAATLGQSRLSTFLRVSLPLAWPGILAGTMLAFARAMGEFGASLMVAGSIPGRTETLSMAIYNASQAGEDHRALVLVLITCALSIAVLLASNYLFNRQPATPSAGRPS